MTAYFFALMLPAFAQEGDAVPAPEAPAVEEAAPATEAPATEAPATEAPAPEAPAGEVPEVSPPANTEEAIQDAQDAVSAAQKGIWGVSGALLLGLLVFAWNKFFAGAKAKQD